MKAKSITALLAAAAAVLMLGARCNDQVSPDRANSGASGQRYEDNVNRSPSNQQGKGNDGMGHESGPGNQNSP